MKDLILYKRSLSKKKQSVWIKEIDPLPGDDGVDLLITRTSKHMFTIIAAKVTRVKTTPREIIQVFKRLLLRLPSSCFILEFLELKSKKNEDMRIFVLT